MRSPCSAHFWVSQQSADIPASLREIQDPQQPDCIPRLISVLIQASHPMSFGGNAEVKQPQSQRDPSVLTSICSALSQFIFSVLFNLCVIWNSQAWRTGDETKCLLSCKYCKWNHGVAPPSSRGVSNYGRVIRLLCQVKSCTSSCVIAAKVRDRR